MKLKVPTAACLAVAAFAAASAERVCVVQSCPGYNSWPMVQAVGERLVCAYSRGSAHTVGEGRRGVFARVSGDSGATWSDEVCVCNAPEWGEVTVGKGLDDAGAMLLWIRRVDKRGWGDGTFHDLWRTPDGVSWTKVASPELNPHPIQITDIFSIPGKRLMSLWFAGGYGKGGGHAWGTLTSADGGRTWVQKTVEGGLEKSEWPTEQSAVHLGGGRILGIARCESGGDCQFQLTSADGGETWKRERTNIGDVKESTPSLVYDAKTKTVFNYYYQRGARKLKCRVANADFVFGHPMEWPEPAILFEGKEERPHDAGNVNATALGGRHFLSLYTGTKTDTTVLVVEADKSAKVAECARIFEEEIRDGVIHGAAVVAGGLDGETLSGAWGWADAAHAAPMTTRTVVDVASVTKAAAGVTAYLAAHARGLVDLDAPFTNYLASYRASLARNVTIRDLANHVSGFGEADGSPRVYFSEDAKTMLRNVLSMPPAEPECGKVVYSCRNYVLLGQAFESIVGCGAAEFCRREVFIPSGMVDSSLGAPLPSVGESRLAQTMGTEGPGVISDFVARPLWAAGIGTFNAGMFSTAEDLAKLMRVYLRGGVCDDGTRLFGPDEMAQIAPSPANRVSGARSFGWQSSGENLPEELFGSSLFHSGWSGQTVLFDLKRRRYAVVLTARCGDYSRAKKDRFRAIAALID